MRVPEVNVNTSELEFIANKVGEKISKTIIVSNPIPETTLQGKWSVLPHPSDPPHTPNSHAWIHFLPQKFEENNINCKVIVDTGKLKADQYYEREVVLISNAQEENYKLKVKVKTAKLKVNIIFPPYHFISIFSTSLIVISWLITLLVIWLTQQYPEVWIDGYITSTEEYISGELLGVIVGGIIGIFNEIKKIFFNKGFNNITTFIYFVSIISTSILTGISAEIGFNPYLITGLLASGLPLTGMLLYPPLRLRQLKAQYRRQ